jgi:rhombotail lipoprotein
MKHATGWFVVGLISSLFLAGCASHKEMRPPRANFSRVGAEEAMLTDDGIKALLDAEVKPKLPTSVAVMNVSAYQLMDAEELLSWEQTFADISGIAGVQPISSISASRGQNLQEIRAAAAKQRCELVLLYAHDDSTVSNYNNAAALYWTFVGLWLVPGSQYEHRTVMQAILVDTRTGIVLGTATGDAHLKRTAPAAYGDIQRDKMQQEAPAQALADLQKGCGQMVADLCKAIE